MLRTARWAEWFKDGTDGHSPYCNWFLYILQFHPECTRRHDLGLRKLLNRFKIMIMTSTSLIRYGPKPYGNWDHRVFYRKFAHGYPPLSQPDLVKKGLLIAVWDTSICCDRLLPPFYWFYVTFMSWRFLQWQKKYRLPRVEFCGRMIPYYWCDDCSRAGFQFWCKDCEDLSLEVIQQRGLRMRRRVWHNGK